MRWQPSDAGTDVVTPPTVSSPPRTKSFRSEGAKAARSVAISARRGHRCGSCLDGRGAPEGPNVGSSNEEVTDPLSRDMSGGVVDEGIEEVTVVGHLATISLLYRSHLALDAGRGGLGRDHGRPQLRKVAAHL